jgi:hypothetical protein
VAHDSRHERFGLPPERPALFARQFRTTTAFIDQYPRLFLGVGRRQLDCHDTALEVDLAPLPACPDFASIANLFGGKPLKSARRRLVTGTQIRNGSLKPLQLPVFLSITPLSPQSRRSCL